MKLMKCGKGHVYDPFLFHICPECNCGGYQPKYGVIDLDRMDTVPGFWEHYLTYPDTGTTVVFYACNDVRFRLWKESGRNRIQMHWLCRPDYQAEEVVFEKEAELSDDVFDVAVNRVLKLLHYVGMENAFPAGNYNAGYYAECRLMLNTWLIRCDYQWRREELPGVSGENGVMRMIYYTLKKILAQAENTQTLPPIEAEPETTLLAELAYRPLMFEKDWFVESRLFQKNNKLVLKLQLEEQLDSSRKLTLIKLVQIPFVKKQELLTELQKSGIMEHILCCAAGPEVPNAPTLRFHLEREGLVFHYSGIYRKEDPSAGKAFGLLTQWVNRYEQQNRLL